MSASAFVRITRPHNAVVAGLTALVGYLIATGTLTPPSLLLAAVVALITAGGNVINDICDVEIDRINRPERPIPAGEISLAGAGAYTAALFAGGIALAALTTTLCFAIALANSIILIAYATRLKGIPVLGNLAVAYLAASVFLFGGAFAGVGGLVQNLSLAAITFLATIAREILKDAEDVDGDAAGGAHTLPMIIGVRRTGILAFACACGAVAASVLPVGDWWSPFYLAAIAVVDAVILFGASRGLSCTTPGCVRESRATSILRTGMFVALAVFAVAAVI
ncbi:MULTISPECIES: geranylgeranylglycerol-phosphate geranylgeranyltransferase [unclassified Methanoculleus]|uniref:geranylgeranylglycerol-phosphate geranylgeranyltransferase n=1 Tax=unclassified Methanoculleus TaxID=2619537 RepID=UPI0025ED4ACA|nr:MULTISPECIES: geranylgeranylglycerol-phosphate geranylgeranyltransferase [unclassified Methanoculleus]MCK9317243.1 geranylgeranylglycerol-phosphate geranylgeranyltransferase [Methanoculleus sp.]MDD2253176.1 geranylgeranylglycerol-phosphate geranylgeranyltransferase [Methanoculleus sp.]MDD2787088.1 geranylgeranylglycerol-phosphate geranylgeranyltransferase [Methanoculleus sp.]MDD3215803.1 geranylgeranylglycerol-phosphate geranylgeranyltransferase [Methanoculleus sp.]MDD4313761.1 geranylgeran